MPTRSLTKAAVVRIKPPKQGQADHFDQGFPGLALRISYGGQKAWTFFYRLRGGKLRRLTLGHFPAMSLAEARDAWRDAREAVVQGENPARKKSQRTPTASRRSPTNGCSAIRRTTDPIARSSALLNAT